MANNRLYIYNPESRKMFMLAKSLGRKWRVTDNANSFVERLNSYLEDVSDEAQYGCSDKPTRLLLITENDPNFEKIAHEPFNRKEGQFDKKED